MTIWYLEQYDGIRSAIPIALHMGKFRCICSSGMKHLGHTEARRKVGTADYVELCGPRRA